MKELNGIKQQQTSGLLGGTTGGAWPAGTGMAGRSADEIEQAVKKQVQARTLSLLTSASCPSTSRLLATSRSVMARAVASARS